MECCSDDHSGVAGNELAINPHAQVTFGFRATLACLVKSLHTA
jgi:hypothetical protein